MAPLGGSGAPRTRSQGTTDRHLQSEHSNWDYRGWGSDRRPAYRNRQRKGLSRDQRRLSDLEGDRHRQPIDRRPN